MPKIVNLGESLNTWSLRSNSVTRQVTFKRTKTGGKCQNLKNSNETFQWFSNIVPRWVKLWIFVPKLPTGIFTQNPFLPQCEGFLLSARQQNCAHFFFFTTSFNHPVDTKLRPIFLLSMLLSGISKSLIKGTQFCFPLRPEPPNECDKSRDFQSLFSDD